jgi:glucose/arabinose dehydrogenase
MRSKAKVKTTVRTWPSWVAAVVLALLVGGVVDPVSALAAAPGPGDVVVANGSSHDVLSINPATKAVNTVSNNAMSTASGGLARLETPFGVARQANGRLVVADQGAQVISPPDGRLTRINPNTGAQSVLAACPNCTDPVGITVAPGGNVYVADENAFQGDPDGDGAIFKVTPGGPATTLSTNGISQAAGGDPFCCFFDPLSVVVAPSGNLLVLDDEAGSTANGAIIRVETAGAHVGRQTVIADNTISKAAGGVRAFSDPRNLTLLPSGNALVTNSNGGGGTPRVIRVNLQLGPHFGAQAVVSADHKLAFPYGVAVDDNGRIFVADSTAFSFQGALFRVSPSTGAQATVASGFGNPRGITLEPSS